MAHSRPFFFIFKSFTLLLLLVSSTVNAQTINRVDPPYWWTAMANDTLELLISGKDLNKEIKSHSPSIAIIEVDITSQHDLAFVKVVLNDDIEPGKVKFTMGQKKWFYELKERNNELKPQGLNTADNIYLITPDRFANGNPKNDISKGMLESTLNRSAPYARHGGDIAGMHSKIDYLFDLGMTALWINPLLENNQPKASYHGYAITDHYRIDPRFGSNLEYLSFIEACHAKGIKVIMDVVYNHFGNEHYLLKDRPDSDFVNQWPAFTQTNYRATTLHDPYAAEADKLIMTRGWFDKHMPDINQLNAHISNYLIQNSIWWIEAYHIDAFRIDTYAYPDQIFNQKLSNRIYQEYPNFFMFGETWVHGIQVQNWFVTEAAGRKSFDSKLESVTDFQLAFAIHKGLKEKNGWAEGINRIYYTLSGDYLYEDPSKLITFIDNHDIARMYGLFDKDLRKYKMALTLLFTTRGIPQVYYGTEILMASTKGHGEIREDFWGGWKEDPKNKFTESGRTKIENEAFNYLKKLSNYRKNSEAITAGNLTQYVPQNGMYCYFRIHDSQKIMVILNANEEAQAIDLSRFENELFQINTLHNILSGQKIERPKNIRLEPYESKVFELHK